MRNPSTTLTAPFKGKAMSLIMTSTGLQYEDLTVGDGEEAKAGS